MKLNKSLEELDAVADELLAKSKAAEDNSKDEELSPEDVSSDSDANTEEDTEEEDEDVKKSCDCSKDGKLTKSDDEDEDDIEKSEDDDDEDIEKCDANGDLADVKKSEDTEDDDEDLDEDDIEKSLQDDFKSNDIIKGGMENSEFMAAVVEVLTKSLSDVQFDVQHQKRVNEASSEIIAKSMQAVIQANATLQATNDRLTRRINKIEKSMSRGFDRVMDTLDEIASQPAGMRKSLASISVQDRDFGSSLNGQPVSEGFESLSKSQVLSVLENELRLGNSNVTPQDIIGYESGAPLRTDLQSLVANKCK